MFQGWRIRLREAEEALDQGRLEDASQLLSSGELLNYLPGRRLCGKVAARFADRARQKMLRGEFAAGWRDLEQARRIGGDSREHLAAREELTELLLSEAESCLAQGDGGRVLELLDVLDRREQPHAAARLLRDVARHLEAARNLCRRGKFDEADVQLETAEAVRPDLEVIAHLRGRNRSLRRRSREIQEQLHRALATSRWSDALTAADSLLELAPENRLARDARRRAWAEVGSRMPDSHYRDEPPSWSGAATVVDAPVEVRDPAQKAPRSDVGNRFLLWIDGVGGYLVCLSDQLTLGQAVPGNNVDIPILGDISRRHAIITRSGDGYVLEPLQPVEVGGRPADARTLLSDGDEIRLGPSVRLRFRQSHALSASARLELLSRHRTEPSADGVLLMAESCVLGPRWQNHVVCRDWTADVVLYRQDGQLYCRSMEPIEIDGVVCDGKGRLCRNARITGDDFAMSLESI